ncbi:MAG: GGDEF domain-containing protein [Betaproteobacteria bacterium]
MSVVNKPNELARETLRQLVLRKITPTPDNYRKLYTEIAGDSDDDPTMTAEKLLQRIALDLPRETATQLAAVNAYTLASSSGQWARAYHLLLELVRGPARGAVDAAPLRSSPRSANTATAPSQELCELLAQTLELSLRARLLDAPGLAAEAAVITQKLRSPAGIAAGLDLQTIAQPLQALWRRAEEYGNGRDKLQNGLLELLQLLIENVGNLVDDDQWLRGQIAAVVRVLSNPLDMAAIEAAKTGLNDLIVRQSLLKQGLGEIKKSMKQMIGSFIDELGHLAQATGDYHDNLENLAQQIRQTDDVDALDRLLGEVLSETRSIQASTVRAREEVLTARQQVDAAEHRVTELEAALAQAGERLRIDSLTGTLNRHGLNHAFEHEIGVATCSPQALSVALLDVDNFNELQSSLGHAAGDEVIKHLARVLRDTVRPGDSVAHFGGEAFLVLLPDADLAAASAVMTRVQRAMTKQIFLHDNARVLITFSAGITRYLNGESQPAVIARAEAALYEAKRNGKNRVCTLPPPLKNGA